MYTGMAALKQPAFWKVMGAIGLTIAAPIVGAVLVVWAIDKIVEKKRR